MLDGPIVDNPVPAAAVATPKDLLQVDLPRQLDQARRVGVTLLNANAQRQNSRFDFWFNTDRMNHDAITAVTAKPNPSVAIDQQAVVNMQLASFDLTLESARQITGGQTEKPPGNAVREDTENLTAIGQSITQGKKLGVELQKTDRPKVLAIGRRMIAQELDQKPEDVSLTDDQVQAWIDEKYANSLPRLSRKLELLRDYLGH